jgi:hypothetical protein
MDTGNSPTGPAPESFSQPSIPEPNSANAAEGNGAAANGSAAPGQRPHQGGGRNRRRRNRSRRSGGARAGQGQGQVKEARQHGANQNRRNSQNPANAFTGPMDHSYRQQGNAEINGNSVNAPSGRNQRGRFGRRFRQGFGGRPNPNMAQPAPLPQEALAPLPQQDDTVRIFAFIEDLFFVTKINETAKKLNVKVVFVKNADELIEKLDSEGETHKPSLIIFDLNNANAKPLVAIPKLKARFKKSASILGFVSHVQGDLKVKAQEAGCDSVMPRSAFSQNLPQLLRRHGAPEDLEQQ